MNEIRLSVDKDSHLSDDSPVINKNYADMHKLANLKENSSFIQKKVSFCEKLSNCFGKVNTMKENRTIVFNGQVTPSNKCANIIKNQKYNIITFIPIVLFNQFKTFFNLFFLLIALSQIFPVLQVGLLITYVGPLVLVIGFTMAREAYDDYQRYIKDKEANSKQYKVFKANGKEVMTKSADLKVGDIIEVYANQRIPADLILIHTTEQGGSVFIRTDQLDGETDWKLRKAIPYTQKYLDANKSLAGLLNAKIIANPPMENIYQFEGVFELNEREGIVDSIRESLNLENTLWASTVLASGIIKAMVIYTGKELRVVLNSTTPRSKTGKLELELNYISKLLFLVMVLISIFLASGNGIYFGGMSYYITFFKFLILLSSIIPISLRVNLDFAKMIYSFQINKDTKILGTIARNSMIPEEVGRIQFLLTDKTGTLTQNDMIFKKLALEVTTITPDNIEATAKILEKQCKKHEGPMSDVIAKTEQLISSGRNISNKPRSRLFKREKEAIIRDLVTSLVLCHNVTPIFEGETKTYQAASPDEIALVTIAETLNMKLLARDQNSITIQNTAGVIERYEILANFPFSSETKRMGILLRNVESNRVFFYLKGADTVMKDKVPEKQRGFLQDESESLALEGLRTLILTQKYLTEDEYKAWKVKYDTANHKLENRDAEVRAAVNLLEVDMEFLGVSGVEDKLQEDCRDTLETLKEAGIQVWMLTGDKIETATCIAISTGIKSNKDNAFIMKELTDPIEIVNKIHAFSTKTDQILIIDGITLGVVLEKCSKIFFETATKAPAVVCCRCSPTQKALVTKGIKRYTGKKTCSVGDGGNDVAMIQAADIGIGIEGKEGKQAALASDYSILKFKYLKRLLLWHGRLSYKRSAILSQFVIHRGLIISLIQAIFSIMFAFIPFFIYSGYLMLGYATIYTMFPVFCLIFDEDVDEESAIRFPPLYKTLQKGRELNSKTFLIWVWKSLYQACVIMIIAAYMFEEFFYELCLITFTSLILTEMLNIFTELHTVRGPAIYAIAGSIIVYFFTVILLKEILVVSSLTLIFIPKIIALLCFSWLPLHAAKLLLAKFDPSEYQKVMKDARKSKRAQLIDAIFKREPSKKPLLIDQQLMLR